MKLLALLAIFLLSTSLNVAAGPTGGGKDAFAMPYEFLSRETRRAFVVGNALFNENWVAAPSTTTGRDGLGPLFLARSCSACHLRDGRGLLPEKNEILTGILVRLSIEGAGSHGGPLPDPIYGGQLALRAVPGVEPEAEAQLEWTEIPGKFADGEPYALRSPVLRLQNWKYGQPHEKLRSSLRLAPAVFGGGLLEGIPEADLRRREDPEDRDQDGISGRLNFVWHPGRNKMLTGRFGWKSNATDLAHQTGAAFLNDMGLRSSLFPAGDFSEAQAERLDKLPNGGNPEVSDTAFDKVVTYLRSLAPPPRRNREDTAVQRGEALFAGLKCAHCHVPEWKTDASTPLAELRGRTFQPYTDLLLHDLGPGLADGRPDHLASGSEWRTAPLWGLGLHETVTGAAFYLHDGRARTLTEAILWHGGEAEASREAFKGLDRGSRSDLLRFLGSL